MQKITLDLVPGKKMPSLNASQFDDGRAYHVDLTENRVPYVLDGTETISVIVRKCDNTLVSMDIANTFGNKSYIEFEVVEQMTACSGFNYGEIILEKNGDRLGSLNFYLQVETAPDENGITSQSEIKNLNRQIDEHVDEVLPDKIAEEVPQAVDDYIGDNYYDKEATDEKFATNEEVCEISENVSVLDGTLNTFPSDILWEDNALKGRLKRTFNGITTNFDASELKPEQGKTYYILPSGNDNNSGEDREHPLQKLSTALAKPDVQTIIVMDGIYNNGRIGGSFTKGVSIIADTDAHPIFIMSRDKSWSKTAGYTKVYQTNDSASAFYGVVKADTRNAEGDLLFFTKVETLAEVETTDNSYYTSGHDVYINSASAPTKTYVLVSGVNCHATLSNGETIYVEGIEFIGGNYGGFRITNGNASKKPLAIFKNCGFAKSYMGNAIYLQGCSGVLQNCYASYSAEDGFNYHATLDVVPDTVEINCIGRHNGTVGNNTNNGSTTHDGAKILRLNCEFYDNIGPNLADVNNSLSFNYGVVSHDSAGASTNKTGFQCQGGSMYNDTCSAYNNDYNFQAYLGGTLYQHNCSGSVDTGADGKAKAY